MLRLHPYRYHRPGSVDEALGLLREHGEDAMPIAGGTDLVPNMKHKLFTPGHLVALRGIEELRGVREDTNGGAGATNGAGEGSNGAGEGSDGVGDDTKADTNGAPGTRRGLRIGAGTSLQTVSSDPAVRERFPSLARACELVSGPQLRRMGTIGGNVCLDTRCTYYNQTRFWRKALGFCLKKEGDVCHVIKGGTRCVAAHSADTPPALITLDATLEIAGAEGRREVPIADFFTSDGIWNRRMERDELLVSVFVPYPERPIRASFQKLRPRGSIDFPILNLAVTAALDDEGRVEELDMVASAMGSYPRRLGRVREAAVGNRLTPSVIDAVAEQAYRQCHPLDNIIVDKEWRRAMVPVLVRRALRELAA